MTGRLCRRNHSSAVSSVLSTLLLFFPANVFLGRCSASDRLNTGQGPIAVEIRRRSRPEASAPVIAANQRRLSDSGEGLGVLDVEDCENAEYSGRIGLGTPVQEFDVVLDTGSYTLWVTGSGCSQNCASNNKYDSSASTTYEPDGTVFVQSYEDGSEAKGILSKDTLSVGGLTSEATFGEISTRSLDGCATVDGVLGMGLSSSGDNQNVFETLVDAGVVDVPIFSFYMGNIDTDTPTGVLTLGGVNQTHYEDCLQWVQIAHSSVDGYWSIDLTDLKLGQDSALRMKATAILDTGSSMVVGPYDDVGYVASQIGAWCIALTGPSSSSVAEIDCLLNPSEVELILMPCSSEFDDLNFMLGQQEFTLTASEMLLPLTDFEPPNPSTLSDPWCLFGMMGHEESLWILGDSFLRTFYTAYDVEEKKVGLAKATSNRAGSTCSEDDSISASGGLGGLSDEDSISTSVASFDKDDDSTDTTNVRAADHEASSSSTNSTSDGDEGIQQVKDNDTKPGQGVEESSWIAVAATTSFLTLIVLLTCCGVGVLVHRRIRRGKTHRHTPLGDCAQEKASGNLEMSSNGGSTAALGGAIVAGAEDDFLQARPGGYRGSGSGSHRYRVAEAGVGTDGGSNAQAVTVLGTLGEEDEEEDDDEVVEVDFGVSNNDASAAAPMGRLSKIFGRGRTGFTAFRDGEESGSTFTA